MSQRLIKNKRIYVWYFLACFTYILSQAGFLPAINLVLAIAQGEINSKNTTKCAIFLIFILFFNDEKKRSQARTLGDITGLISGF